MQDSKIENGSIELLIENLYDENNGIRSSAAEGLGNLGDTKAIEPLVQALNDDYFYVRSCAAEALGKMNDSKVVDALIDALNDNYSQVRYKAIVALGKIGDCKTIAAIKQRAEFEPSFAFEVWKAKCDFVIRSMEKKCSLNSKDKKQLSKEEIEHLIFVLKEGTSREQMDASRTLINSDNAYASEPLIQILMDPSSNFYAKRETAYVLANIGDTRAFEVLKKSLIYDDIKGHVAKYLINFENMSSVDSIITSMINADYEDTSFITMVSVLENIGKPAVKPLISILNSDDATARKRAAQILGKIGDLRATEALMHVMENDDDEKVKTSAANSLYNMKNPAVLDFMITNLNHKDAKIRSLSAWIIGNLGNSKAVDPLIDTLGDRIVDVRCKAIMSLGKLGNQKVVEVLIELLNDNSVRVRTEAAEALGNLGNPKAVESLIVSLNDEYNVHNRAIVALGQIGDERATIPLLKLLIEDKDLGCSSRRKKLIHSIKSIDSPKICEHLESFLKDNEKNIRIGTLRLIEELQPPESSKLIHSVANDSNKNVRAKAMELIAKFSDSTTFDSLIQSIYDENEIVRSNAAESLGKLGDSRAIDPLIQSLYDENEIVRSNAAESLGKLGDSRAIDSLIQSLSDKNEEVRISAIYAIMKIGDVKTIGHLVGTFKMDYSTSGLDVSDIAEDILSFVESNIDKVPIEPLITALEDDNFDVRFFTLHVYQSIGDTNVIEPLINCLKLDVNPHIRGMAALVLGNFKEQRVVLALEEASNDSNLTVQKEANDALNRIMKSS